MPDETQTFFDNARRILGEIDALRHTVGSQSRSVVKAQQLADAQVRDLEAKLDEFRTDLHQLSRELDALFPKGQPLVR
jgi:type II secretory pathway predicted ATPase ExeA